MDRKELLRVLLLLADGVNPETGESYGNDSPYQSPLVVRALFQAARELEAAETGEPPVAAASPERRAFELPPLDAAGAALFARLRAWRNEAARAAEVPPYLVASNRALSHLAAIRPTSPEELLQAHGVGPHKVEQYGAEILAIIRDLGASEAAGGSK